MQPLQAPAVLHESHCEIVEKLRVCWTIAKLAEIARRADDATTEIFLPDAIHNYASRQRVLFIKYRVGKFQPPTAGRKTAAWLRQHDFNEASFHGVAEVVVFSTKSSPSDPAPCRLE